MDEYSTALIHNPSPTMRPSHKPARLSPENFAPVAKSGLYLTIAPVQADNSPVSQIAESSSAFGFRIGSPFTVTLAHPMLS